MGAPPPQYEPIVTEGNEALVHHMEVFQCAAEVDSVPHFSGPCDSKMKPERLNYCRHVLAAWALGAKVRALPASPQGDSSCKHRREPGGSPKSPLSPLPLCCWGPMALWSHRCLLILRAVPRGHRSRSPSSSAGFAGGRAQGGPGAGRPGCVQGLPAAQRWGLGGGLAWG